MHSLNCCIFICHLSLVKIKEFCQQLSNKYSQTMPAKQRQSRSAPAAPAAPVSASTSASATPTTKKPTASKAKAKKSRTNWDKERVAELLTLFKENGKNYKAIAALRPEWNVTSTQIRSAFSNIIAKQASTADLQTIEKNSIQLPTAGKRRRKAVPMPLNAVAIQSAKNKAAFAANLDGYIAAKTSKNDDAEQIDEDDDDEEDDDEEEPNDNSNDAIEIDQEVTTVGQFQEFITKQVKEEIQRNLQQQQQQNEQDNVARVLFTPTKSTAEQAPSAGVFAVDEREQDLALPEMFRPFRLETSERYIFLFRNYSPFIIFNMDWVTDANGGPAWFVMYSIAPWPSQLSLINSLHEATITPVSQPHAPSANVWSYHEPLPVNVVKPKQDGSSMFFEHEVVYENTTYSYYVFFLTKKEEKSVMKLPVSVPKFKKFESKAPVVSITATVQASQAQQASEAQNSANESA